VILAGYPKEMAELLERNPGLPSRFPKTILFPNYTKLELMQIIKVQATDSGLKIDPGAEASLLPYFGKKARRRIARMATGATCAICWRRHAGRRACGFLRCLVMT